MRAMSDYSNARTCHAPALAGMRAMPQGVIGGARARSTCSNDAAGQSNETRAALRFSRRTGGTAGRTDGHDLGKAAGEACCLKFFKVLPPDLPLRVARARNSSRVSNFT